MFIDNFFSKKENIVINSDKCSQIKLASEVLVKKNKDVFFIIDESEEISEYFDLCSLFINKFTFFKFPSLDFKTEDKFLSEIVKGLFLLNQKTPKLVFIPYSTFLLRFPCPEEISKQGLTVQPGDTLELESFLERLVAYGYKRVVQVSFPGEFALKGDILDIFSSNYAHPLRIELFGDNIEQIRFFEPLSQKSIKFMEKATIIPYTDLFNSQKEKFNHLSKTGEIKNNIEVKFWGLYFINTTNLLNFSNKKVLFIPKSEDFTYKLKKREEELNYFCQEKNIPYIHTFYTTSEIKDVLSQEYKIFFPYLSTENYDFKLKEEKISSYEDIFWKPEERIRPIKALKQKIKEWQSEYKQVIFSFETKIGVKKFLKVVNSLSPSICTEYNLNKKGLFVVNSKVRKGYVLKWDNVLILSERVLLPQKATKVKHFKGLQKYDSLKEGDLVIHRDYGLAYFAGLRTIQVGGISKEFLLLLYANEDKLYLPVEKINLIQKYKGPESHTPSLDKLGGSSWQRSKAKVRKEVAKIAKDLVEMYAYRKIAKKFKYIPLDEDYYEFEASFGFEETPDQSKVIEEVLIDMDKDVPMDRLVCGDVGFGKTEVAMRAAFRAVQNGYQVCLLCPTTVLAEQHWQNFKERMEPFGIQVAMLSRFVKKSEQKNILQKVKEGKVDILIGTHRLLSKDVIIPKLSLLILDEEQRFGVRHKEKLKQIKKEVDVLTLTATPIPRTLQLSLSGVRDLSIIETPPPERKPVTTKLLERNKGLLKEILERELARKGQVFWVYNRIQGLNRIAEEIKNLVPLARIGIAHGQMSENNLEQIMHQFWKKEIDILVCTSIIESGLDFPNANTLIVDNAHLFGLGQLYQLRGRVGRSEKQAYAYFLVPKLNSLPEKSKKRLKIILSLDYLGAGFQLAMEDLRLRGAGNILGEAQSGFIGKVGLDLFLEMLNEEVKRLKGEKIEEKIEPEIESSISSYIPSNYIEDSKERINYYQLLVNSENKRDDILDEIKDRFGEFPEEFINFINLIEVKEIARELNLQKINIREKYFLLKWDNENINFDVSQIMNWLNKEKNFQFLTTGELKLYNSKGENPILVLKNNLKELKRFLLC